jgi:hypothetical protein
MKNKLKSAAIFGGILLFTIASGAGLIPGDAVWSFLF